MTEVWIGVYLVIGLLWARFFLLRASTLAGGVPVRMRAVVFHVLCWPVLVPVFLVVYLLLLFRVIKAVRKIDKEDAETLTNVRED